MSPQRAPRPCAAPMCGELVRDGNSQCEKHRKQHQRLQDDPKTSHREREFYWSTRWRKTRALFIRVFPFCELCAAKHIFRAGEEVHHRQPISEGGDRYAFSNLQHLCRMHHSQITRKGMNDRGA
jgi:5-methylcytosine-specific restriction protein A